MSHALSLNNTCIHVHASIILVHYSPLDLCHARPLTDDISSSNCASRFCVALTTSEGARRSLPAESLAKPEPGLVLKVMPGRAAATPSCCARCGGTKCPLCARVPLRALRAARISAARRASFTRPLCAVQARNPMCRSRSLRRCRCCCKSRNPSRSSGDGTATEAGDVGAKLCVRCIQGARAEAPASFDCPALERC